MPRRHGCADPRAKTRVRIDGSLDRKPSTISMRILSLSWGEGQCFSVARSNCRINLPHVDSKMGLENTLLVDKMFDELGLASPSQPTDGCSRGGPRSPPSANESLWLLPRSRSLLEAITEVFSGGFFAPRRPQATKLRRVVLRRPEVDPILASPSAERNSRRPGLPSSLTKLDKASSLLRLFRSRSTTTLWQLLQRSSIHPGSSRMKGIAVASEATSKSTSAKPPFLPA